MESYYDTLGVTPNVDAAQLRRAYRRAVKQAHPDTGGSAEAFTAVQAAWHTLSDPTRRNRYDNRNRPAPPDSPTRPAPSAWTAAPPPGQPQPARDARSSSAAASSSGTTRRTAWITAGLSLASVATGALTWLIIADIGSLFAVLGGVYLVAITWCLVARRRGSSHGSRILARLLRGAWILAAASLLLGLATWTTGRDPLPALIWTAIVITFAAATTVLSRTTMNESE